MLIQSAPLAQAVATQAAARPLSAPSHDLDVMASPEMARKWIRVCQRNRVLLERCQSLYIAAQLTLLGTGEAMDFA